MRKTAILLMALALAGVVAAEVSTASGLQTTRARLLLVDTEPLTFRGLGFKPNERVQLVAVAGARSVRRVATGSASGTFTMRVPGVNANNCAGFSVTATGGRGSRATFKRPPGQCPIP
jgi:hypothetical protein